MLGRPLFWTIAKRFFHVIFAVYLGSFAANAAAQQGQSQTLTDERIKGLFRFVDMDSDGRITHTELRLMIVILFMELDADKNSALSHSEVPNVNEENFSKADVDSNGVLSPFEFHQSEFMVFARFDVDENQYITLDEVMEHQRRMRQ